MDVHIVGTTVCVVLQMCRCSCYLLVSFCCLKPSSGRKALEEVRFHYDVDMECGSRWYTPDFHMVTFDIRCIIADDTH